MENKRIEWIDLAKGVAIILVMMGHTHFSSQIITWIYSFHIPLFFFLSGLTFSPYRYSAKEFIKNKINRLLVPAFFFSIIIFAFNVAVGKADLSLRRILICIVSEVLQLRGGVRMSGPWFLISLFVVEIALYFFLNQFSEKIVTVICICCGIMGTVYMTYMSTYLPWSLDASLVSIVYVYLGYRLKNWLISITFEMNSAYVKHCTFIFILILINVTSCILNFRRTATHVDLYATILGNPILYWIESLSGTIAIILFMVMLSSMIPHGVKSILLHLGTCSIFIYMAHGMLFEVIDRTLHYFGLKFENFDNLQLSGIGSIYIILGVVVLLLLYEPVSHKLPFLVGVKKIEAYHN